MLILPAIDLRGGRCVRLRQGRYDEETVFDTDPVAVARRYEQAGARWLHVVDLDGARLGRPGNLEQVASVVRAVGMQVELGGGIRTTETAREVLDLGVARVIVGTRAIREPAWLEEVAREFRDRVAVSIDAHLAAATEEEASQSNASQPPDVGVQTTQQSSDTPPSTMVASSFLAGASSLALSGWESDSHLSPKTLIDALRGKPVGAIICTDIARDGMMSGANVDAMAELVRQYGSLKFIASGGVTTTEDVRRLREAGVHGAIIGRALYEGSLALEDALEAAGPQGG